MEVLAVNNIIKLGSNGLKAQKITAQGNALGGNAIVRLRSDGAKDEPTTK